MTARNGAALCARSRGKWQPMDPGARQAHALQRFREKCRFDPVTGCVLWTGGTTSGRGNSALYGSFWYEGARWFAHRWAGIFVHGLDLEGVQAGHNCPHGPNTLCVQHVTGQSQLENLEEMHARRAAQSNTDRQFWLFVSLGLEPAPAIAAPDNDGVPFYQPPAWLTGVDGAVNKSVDCPF